MLARLSELSAAFVSKRVKAKEGIIQANFDGSIEDTSELALRRFRAVLQGEVLFGFVLHELNCRRKEPMLDNKKDEALVTCRGITLASLSRKVFFFYWS